MVATNHITTAEQLLAAGDIGRCELVHGDLRMMTPAGFRHGRLISRLTSRLDLFVERHRLGAVTGAETGYRLQRDPDTVLAPDIAFVSRRRVDDPSDSGFFNGAPDLACEVLSPSDRAGEVEQKVEAWLNAGCAMVWVINPSGRSVTVHKPGGEARVLRRDEILRGDPVVPGFELSLTELFADPLA